MDAKLKEAHQAAIAAIEGLEDAEDAYAAAAAFVDACKGLVEDAKDCEARMAVRVGKERGETRVRELGAMLQVSKSKMGKMKQRAEGKAP